MKAIVGIQDTANGRTSLRPLQREENAIGGIRGRIEIWGAAMRFGAQNRKREEECLSITQKEGRKQPKKRYFCFYGETGIREKFEI